MKRVVSNLKIMGMIVGLNFGSASFAVPLVLPLEANGTITGSAGWYIGDAPIDKASFDFTGQSPGAGKDVKSGSIPLTLRQQGADGQTKSVALERPVNCTIGTTSVSPEDVVLVLNGVEQAVNGNVSFTIGSIMPTEMRFKANYGTAFGRVNCGIPGKLTFEF